jgi:hypothetical protein
MESVLQDKKECFECYTNYNLHDHHILYGTANRKKSELFGLKVWLCGRHHNQSNEGVHFNRHLDLRLKIKAQEFFEDNYGDRERFIKEFGKSYL